jgi:hypothetical protein
MSNPVMTVRDAIVSKTQFSSIHARKIVRSMIQEVADAHSRGEMGFDFQDGEVFRLKGKTRVTLRSSQYGWKKEGTTDAYDLKNRDVITATKIATEFLMVCRNSKKFIWGLNDVMESEDVDMDIE